MYRPRQRSFTVNEAFEHAQWLHWLGDDIEAIKMLKNISRYATRNDENGEERKPAPQGKARG
jgi:hypothetical protein